MDERLRSILDGLGRDEIAKVAAAALGAATARPGPLTFREITAPHSDARTIGIVRVSGTAEVGGAAREWSSVTKIVDTSVEGRFIDASIPENEEIVYERGLFTDLGIGFRPAHCYHISRPGRTLKVLWLEDLTGARGAPFEIAELSQMVRHLGEWNAINITNPRPLGFTAGRDYPMRRWNEWNFARRADELKNLDADPMLQAMYARQPIGLAREYADVLGVIISRSTSALPHVLSFGDGPIGNYFHTPQETIAVDWSGLSVDPVGADGGCFIGSAITWGTRFADVAENERALFDCYAEGVARGGADVERTALRLGYLSHLGFYLGTMTVFPTMVAGPYALLTREFLEKRFGQPLEQIGDQTARIIDLVPAFIAEAKSLIAENLALG